MQKSSRSVKLNTTVILFQNQKISNKWVFVKPIKLKCMYDENILAEFCFLESHMENQSHI